MARRIDPHDPGADVIEFLTERHLATLTTHNARGDLQVTPVGFTYEPERALARVITWADSIKARNVAANPNVALHWQVTEVGDGVEVWGTAELFTDVETKKRLWDDVFDYDLNAFAPGGPENSPGTGFLAITPQRALILHKYGMGGAQRWSA